MPRTVQKTIPLCIHQTAKVFSNAPPYGSWMGSWLLHCGHDNGWRHSFTNDADNRRFIVDKYPWFLSTYDAYPENIMRVDAFRYFLLHHYGGVYVDMDFECLTPIDALLKNRSLLLGEEPKEHVDYLVTQQYKKNYAPLPPLIVCNAFMASIAGHPFWETVFSVLLERAQEPDTIFATGPLMLSHAWESYTNKNTTCVILPSAQLYPLTATEALLGDIKTLLESRIKQSEHTIYAVHYWAGSWIKGNLIGRWLRQWLNSSKQSSFLIVRRLISRIYQSLFYVKSVLNTILKARQPLFVPVQSQPSRNLSAAEKQQDILVAVPVKNAASFLPNFLKNLACLSYDAKYLHLAFLESDSSDNTWSLLNKALPSLRARYGSVRLHQKHFNFKLQRTRYHQSEQYLRRSVLAKSRNLLLELFLSDQNWVLWIDADIAWWPNQIIECLLATNQDIIVPNCVTPYGDDFDLNNFQIRDNFATEDFQRYIYDGIIQPPIGYGRRYLNDFLGQQYVALDSVGGAMLLVRSKLHKEGIIFPAKPYRQYIETEGLAMIAADRGYKAWGMPDVHIIHPSHRL